MSHARNVGIEHATGEWLTFVDADDRLEPNHLQLLMEATQTGEPEIVVGGWTKHALKIHLRESCEAVDEETLLSKEHLVQSPSLLVYIWDKLFRKTLLLDNGVRFNTNMSYGEDAILAYQCALATERIKAIPLSGYVHVLTGDSAIDRYHAEMEAAYTKILELKCELMVRAGIAERDMNGRCLRHKRDAAKCCVLNLFLPGCPFSFSEKVREIRRIMFDDPDMRAVMACEDRKGRAFFNRVCDAVYGLHSPLAMALVYQLLLPPVTFYRNYISWRFRY